MTDFDPGEGWREVDISDENTAVYELARYGDDGELIAGWVRHKPVPPLPTEPYTIVSVTWMHGPTAILVLTGEYWQGLGHNDEQYLAHNLHTALRGFEVLSEPRAVTAKAVLDAAADFFDITWTPAAAVTIGREFGVEA